MVVVVPDSLLITLSRSLPLCFRPPNESCLFPLFRENLYTPTQL